MLDEEERPLEENPPEEMTGTGEFPAEEEQRAYYIEEKITLADIKQHISGPIISIIVHIFLLTVVGTAIMFDPPPKEKEEIMVEAKDVNVTPPPEPPPPPPPPPETEITDATFSDIPVDRPAPAQADAHYDAPSPVASSSVATANTDFVDNLMVESSMPVVEQSKSALKLPGAFAMRSRAGRMRAIKAYGGSRATENAVDKALEWLVKVQNEDGSWGDMEDQYNQMVQLTCLALLAFLAHGETPDSERYGETLMRGLQKVLEWEANYPSTVSWMMGKRNRGDWYSHSRICIVLSEGYAITKIPALESGMNRAVDIIIHGRTDSEENHHRYNRGQNPIGGWGWGYNSRDGLTYLSTNLDYGSRIYNALYSAWNAGCQVDGIKEAIKKSARGMAEFHGCKGGGFNANMVKSQPTLESLSEASGEEDEEETAGDGDEESGEGLEEEEEEEVKPKSKTGDGDKAKLKEKDKDQDKSKSKTRGRRRGKDKEEAAEETEEEEEVPEKKKYLSHGGKYNGNYNNPTFDASGAGTLYLYLMAAAFDDSEKEEMDAIVAVAKKGFDYLANYTPNKESGSELKMDWKNLPSQTSSLGWYYMTQALFQSTSGKGKLWRRWNNSVKKTLLKEQSREGYWVCPADKYKRFEEKMVNVGTPERPRMKKQRVEKVYNESSQGGFTDLNGKIWATVYLTLALEVYYRYLPTFKPDGSRTPLYIGEEEKSAEAAGTGKTAAPKKEEKSELSLDE